MIVNGEKGGVSETIGESAVLSGAVNFASFCAFPLRHSVTLIFVAYFGDTCHVHFRWFLLRDALYTLLL